MSAQSVSSARRGKNHRSNIRSRRKPQCHGKMNGETALPDFSHSLPMLLMRSREAVMRLFRPSLRAHHVTEQQWRVLRTLAHIGECEVTELARITFLHAPSLSRISRDLLRQGLIQRTSGATDRRRGIVSISKRGRDLIKKVAPDSEASYSQIRRRFGAKRLEVLQQMLQELEMTLVQPGAAWERED